MRQAADTYAYGDGALMRFIRTLKQAIDPGGILAPGKQGI